MVPILELFQKLICGEDGFRRRSRNLFGSQVLFAGLPMVAMVFTKGMSVDKNVNQKTKSSNTYIYTEYQNIQPPLLKL